MLKRKQRRQAERAEPMPELVARFLLGGFPALIPAIKAMGIGRVDEIPDSDGDTIFQLFQGVRTGYAAKVFRQHETWLRRMAKQWDIAPDDERGRFWAECGRSQGRNTSHVSTHD